MMLKKKIAIFHPIIKIKMTDPLSIVKIGSRDPNSLVLSTVLTHLRNYLLIYTRIAILLPFQYTAVVASVLVVLFVLVLIIIACMIVAICLKRRSHEDKTKSFQQSERVDPKQKPDAEVASSMEMGRVRDELPDSDYGIVEEAATTTFESKNSFNIPLQL